MRTVPRYDQRKWLNEPRERPVDSKAPGFYHGSYHSHSLSENILLETRLAAISKTLIAHDQAHVLSAFDRLAPDRRSALLDQLETIDWDQVERFRKLLKENSADATPLGDIQPPPVRSPRPGDAEWLEARRTGDDLLHSGKVSVVTLAGGQGTRLGFDHPKGMFAISPVRGKTLFQLHAEKLQALSRRCGRAIPWCLMTSVTNDSETREYFRGQDYFGLDPHNVSFFVQAMVPALDADGHLLMNSPSHVFVSPDGHGGTLNALEEAGVLDHLEARGVEEVFTFQVDNTLIKIADPVFLGLHRLAGAQMSCKVCPKRSPDEKVGIAVLVNGRTHVIEYSDLPDKPARQRDATGSLRFGAGSIAIHAFRMDFLRRLGRDAVQLPWHVADKKVPTVDETGRSVEPERPNARKFERFIFDALPLAETVVLMQVDRADEFAPLKQMTGTDSAESARLAMTEQAARWLGAVGVSVPKAPDGLSLYSLEISPLLALVSDDLTRQVSRDLVINGPFYLGPDS